MAFELPHLKSESSFGIGYQLSTIYAAVKPG